VLDRLDPMLAGRCVAVEVPPTLPPTPMDFTLMTQVLTNLVDNAARYSPPTAAISVAAEVVRDQLRVAGVNEGSRIPETEAGRPREPGLGRPLHTSPRLSAAPGGPGLGLSIARGFVEAHGGRIWAENVGRRGVVFRLTLPSPPPPAGRSDDAEPVDATPV